MTMKLDNITLNVGYKLTNLPGLHIYTQSVSNHLVHSKADDGSANWLLRPPEIKTSGIEGITKQQKKELESTMNGHSEESNYGNSCTTQHQWQTKKKCNHQIKELFGDQHCIYGFL
ncbi:hypothetical protein BLOT_010217 [Blomia tropicalis]|nr:hypothetical protein BLOT_010217 [Blomia tropicalis]